MKKPSSHSVTSLLIVMIALVLSSMACRVLAPGQEMVRQMLSGDYFIEWITRIFTDRNDEFLDLLPELLEIYGDTESVATSRIFTGTANYDVIFRDLNCPGYQTTDNSLMITVAEEGQVTGVLSFGFNSGSCEYTRGGETFVQVLELTLTGTFEGTIIDNKGTITLYEDVTCTTVYDSGGKDYNDPDCNLFPYREVDVTIDGNQMSGLIRAPGTDEFGGLFNVTFTATQR